MHDELRYATRKALMQDNTKEAYTFRHSVNDTALPIRRWASFLPGTGLGGSIVHWNGQTFRFQDDTSSSAATLSPATARSLFRRM